MAKAVAVEKGSRFSVRFHVDGLWCLGSLVGMGWRGGLHGAQEGFRLLISSAAKHGHLLLLTVPYTTKMWNCKKKKKFKLKTFVPPVLKFQIY